MPTTAEILLDESVMAAQDEPRDRVDLRVPPAWHARVKRQADRLGGIGVSAYIRQAVSRQLEIDEASDPSLARCRKPPK